MEKGPDKKNMPEQKLSQKTLKEIEKLLREGFVKSPSESTKNSDTYIKGEIGAFVDKAKDQVIYYHIEQGASFSNAATEKELKLQKIKFGTNINEANNTGENDDNGGTGGTFGIKNFG